MRQLITKISQIFTMRIMRQLIFFSQHGGTITSVRNGTVHIISKL